MDKAERIEFLSVGSQVRHFALQASSIPKNISIIRSTPFMSLPFLRRLRAPTTHDNPRDGSLSVPALFILSSVLLSVTAIFVAIVVFNADFHAAPGSVGIDVTPVVPIPVRTVPVPIAALRLAITTHITATMHSPVLTHFVVIMAHTIAIAVTHHPAASHLTVVAPRAVAVAAAHFRVWAHLAVFGLRLVASDSLILLWLGVVSRGRSSGLRSCRRRFSLLLGE
jgi:hypothetical protein